MSKQKEMTLENNEAQVLPAGLKWLAEMEALNSPSLLNVLYGNVSSFPNIAYAEILIDRYNKKMLIWVEFNWLTRKLLKYRKKETTVSLLDQLQEFLPSFTFRIIEDKSLFDKAVTRMAQGVLKNKGDKNEKDNLVSADVSKSYAASSNPKAGSDDTGAPS